MHYLWMFCALVLAVVYIFDRHAIRIDWKAVGNFSFLFLIAAIASITFNRLIGRVPPAPPFDAPALMFVWWEDVLFSLLAISYAERFLPRWAYAVTAVVGSLIFGAAHAYQGWPIALIACFYPYFVSYRFGKSHGYGTVMILHVLYDLTVFGAMCVVKGIS